MAAIKLFNYKAFIDLHSRLTFVIGDSGVGKTLIYEYFNDISYDSSEIVCYNAEELVKIQKSGDTLLNRLSKCKNMLIVIDNADVVLSNKDRQFICLDDDRGNNYLIFGRNPSGLLLTADNIVEIIRDDYSKIFTFNYKFKEVNKL